MFHRVPLNAPYSLCTLNQLPSNLQVCAELMSVPAYFFSASSHYPLYPLYYPSDTAKETLQIVPKERVGRYRRSQELNPFHEMALAKKFGYTEIVSITSIVYGKEVVRQKNPNSIGSIRTFGFINSWGKTQPTNQNVSIPHPLPLIKLRDTMLRHNTKSVKELVRKLEKFHHSGSEEIIIVPFSQLVADYPALMIWLNPNYSPHKEMMKRKVPNEYTTYTKLLSHLLTAHINKALYESGVGVYVNYRQSFGFLSPTLTATASSFRLSLGLVPNQEWIAGAVKGIEEFNEQVKTLWKNKILEYGEKGKMGKSHSIFRNGQISSYAHRKIFPCLIENEPTKLLHFLNELKLKNNPYVGNHLAIKISPMPSPKGSGLCFGKESFDLFKEFHRLYKSLIENDTNIDLESEINSFFSFVIKHGDSSRIMQQQMLFLLLLKNVDNKIEPTFQMTAHELIQLLERQIYFFQKMSIIRASQLKTIASTNETHPYDHNDARFSSLSASEFVLFNAHNTYYTTSGMSALACPLFTFKATILKGKLQCFRAPYSYFEAAGWTGFKEIHFLDQKQTINATEKMNKADVIYVDRNPCITGEGNWISPGDILKHFKLSDPTQALKPRMVIVDITSSTSEQIQDIVTQWKESSLLILCFAKSGLKHDQAGLDMAQYGEVQLLINHSLLLKCDQNIKEKIDRFLTLFNEQTGQTSSPFATFVRREYALNAGRITQQKAARETSFFRAQKQEGRAEQKNEFSRQFLNNSLRLKC